MKSGVSLLSLFSLPGVEFSRLHVHDVRAHGDMCYGTMKLVLPFVCWQVKSLSELWEQTISVVIKHGLEKAGLIPEFVPHGGSFTVDGWKAPEINFVRGSGKLEEEEWYPLVQRPLRGRATAKRLIEGQAINSDLADGGLAPPRSLSASPLLNLRVICPVLSASCLEHVLAVYLVFFRRSGHHH